MIKKTLTLLTLAISAPFFADENPQGKNVQQSPSYWSIHPLHLGVKGQFSSSAKMKHKADGELSFYRADQYVDLLVPFNQKNFVIPKVEFSQFHIKWNENPYFTEDEFNYMRVGLTGLSKQINNFKLIGFAEYRFDLEHMNEVSTYGVFSGSVWGAYNLTNELNAHLGIYGYGEKIKSVVYPVLGLEYVPNEKWAIFAVFPLDYYVKYNFTKLWHGGVRGRTARETYRINDKQLSPHALLVQTSRGLEAFIEYEIPRKFHINVFLGAGLGGHIEIFDTNATKLVKNEFKSNTYGGISLNYGF
jgi:hypothetical protein